MWALLFLFGVGLTVVSGTALDGLILLWLLPFNLLLLLWWRSRSLGVLLLALLAVSLHQLDYHACLLPPSLEGERLQVVGSIASIPRRVDGRASFLFRVEQLETPQSALQSDWLLRLNCYRDCERLQAGERWSLPLKLKRPHGFHNPGGFDYQQWLQQQGVHATGYLHPKGERQRLSEAGWRYGLLGWRQRTADRVDGLTAALPFRGVLKALLLGERSEIPEDQRQLFRATGTSHLIAISGLHIGLVALLGQLLAGLLWQLLPLGLQLRINRPIFAAYLALLVALLYAALAGFSLPTQRALIMLTLLLGGVILRRQWRFGTGLAWALFLVLLLDPLAVISAGFWLSFAAVATLFYLFMGRSPQSRWRRWGLPQLALAVSLSPLLLLFFQQTSLSAPLANLLAVPLMSFLVVPLVLLAALAMPLSESLAERLFGWADQLLEWLWPLLTGLSELPWGVWHGAVASHWLLLPTLLGMLLLWAPRGIPARWLALPLLLPLFLWRPAPLLTGALRLTLLDVGQGLSVVLQTREHLLVYDTGAQFSERFDSATAVIIPFLRHHAVERIDRLVLSHSDSDHAGALRPLLANFPVTETLSSQPEQWPDLVINACLVGQRWHWDGVWFEFLHPTLGDGGESDNNRSCVLKVTTVAGSVLLPGDIEQKIERRLVAAGADLLSTLLVAAHHGSRSSSSSAFVEAVKPDYVLYASGYRNRFHFPHPQVDARFAALGAQSFNSAEQGAISVLFDPVAGVQISSAVSR